VLSDAGLSRLHAVGADLLALGALLEAAHPSDVLANGLLAHLRGCGETLGALHPRRSKALGLDSRRFKALSLGTRRSKALSGKAATAATAALDVEGAGSTAATAATATATLDEGAGLLASATATATATLDGRGCAASAMFAGLRCRGHANRQRRDSSG
jgi:hypothetical protein